MTFALSALGLIALFYAVFIVPTQWVKIERVSYPIGLNKRVLQISDLHVEKLRISPGRLKRIILEVKPDYIFLTGDYTMRLGYLGKVASYLRVVKDTGIPAYAVLGNHDYRLKGHLSKLLHLFSENGIRVLRNESADLGDFRLIGIDDDSSRKSNPAKAFRRVRPDETAVVITHDPNVTLKIKRGYNYLMCGHFHGGQFRVPFIFRFVKKGPLPKRGIYQGLHRDEHGVFYISKGAGQAGFNARFMIRSELTVHEL
ncbi:metallophosphoesterase [Paenibacillus alkalitolerans]|uniref:metallophosphoesterase n=1 Tax=Paenibacillus alkalitolerans TaxID=2799335 RepID=UPI0018F6AF32|nr:metallophosphoesterase [Paenibacillus alkalitolerans]